MPLPLTPITAFNGLTVPSRADPANFPARGDTWNGAFQPFTDQANVLAGQVNAMADAASASQVAAAASQSAAAASATTAQNYASAAGTLAGAVMFNAATAYTQGEAAISALNFRTYRRRTAGTSATDPASDPTNWAPQSTYANLITTAGTLEEANYVFTKDVAVTLPDLTTQKQLTLTIPSNMAAFTSAITTADSWTINPGFSAGVTKTHVPMAFGSPHGWWGSAAMTPPLNATSSAIGAAAQHVASCALTATLEVHIFYDASSPGAYAVAINPSTGAVGAPVFVGDAAPTSNCVYAIDSTRAIVFTNAAANNAFVLSVSGLTISVGTGVNLGQMDDIAVQLTSTTYAYLISSVTNNLVVLSISGTTITVGTAVASGRPSTSSAVRIAPISGTSFLVMYPSSFAGSSTLSARVASVSGTTITMNAVATSSGTSIVGDQPNLGAHVISAGTSYMATTAAVGAATNSVWYGITVSGTTVTIGTALAITGLNGNQYKRGTFVNRAYVASRASNRSASVNSSTVLVLDDNAGTKAIVAISISGSNLSAGALYTTDSPLGLLVDVSTGSNIYVRATTTYSKLSVSGTSISAAYTVAATPTFILSDTLTDKTVNYSATWYTWTLGTTGTIAFPVSASKFATISTNVLRIYGSFS